MSAARSTHFAQTLPWDDQGSRPPTVANYEGYTELIDALRERMVRERVCFIEDYDDNVDKARLDLCKLLNPDGLANLALLPPGLMPAALRRLLHFRSPHLRSAFLPRSQAGGGARLRRPEQRVDILARQPQRPPARALEQRIGQACLRACMRWMAASTVFSAISRCTKTGLSWPIRCARSMAWRSAAGFHHGS